MTKYGTYYGIDMADFGILDRVDIWAGRAIDMINFAFIAGSSKHGKARLASVGWNCVAATQLKD